MEEAFNKLQKDGKNDVDNLMKWMKDAKVIDASKDQEDKARGLFDALPDKKNVTLDKFKEIITKLAAELNINMEGLSKQLAEHGPKLLQAAMAGGATSKLKNLMK